MAKKIFINATDSNTINLDQDENSWKQTVRVASLLNRLHVHAGQETDICLYGLPATVGPDECMSLIKLSAYSNLYKVDNFISQQGLFPLMLNDTTLYFTDVEDFTHLDGKWAADHIYKTDFDSTNLNFDPYTPAIPQNVTLGRIPSQNIKVGDLYKVVDTELNHLISGFCAGHQNEDVQITYTDRYVKTELGLIITLLFIKNIINALHPSNYNVQIIGERYMDYDVTESYRRLSDNFEGDRRRDQVGGELIQDNNYTFVSKDRKAIPHHRELLIQATDGAGQTHEIRIHPDAGLAQWKLDTLRCKRLGIPFNTNQGINEDIYIYSDAEQLYFLV